MLDMKESDRQLDNIVNCAGNVREELRSLNGIGALAFLTAIENETAALRAQIESVGKNPQRGTAVGDNSGF